CTLKLPTVLPRYRSLLFFFTHPATTQIYTLSLHDSLPISVVVRRDRQRAPRDLVQVQREYADQGAGEREEPAAPNPGFGGGGLLDRKSTRLNSSHVATSYAVFCLKKKNEAAYVATKFLQPW